MHFYGYVPHYTKSHLLRFGLPQQYMNFSGHQSDEPTGSSGGLQQLLKYRVPSS